METNLFNLKTPKQKADSALSLFRTAVNKLKESSIDALDIIKRNDSRVAELESETSSMRKLVDDNEVVRSNIENLIGKSE